MQLDHRLLRIILLTRLRRNLEPLRRIPPRHIQLDELQPIGLGELLVLEEPIELLLCAHGIGPVRPFLGAEGVDELRVAPGLDVVVVLGGVVVDLALDLEAVVDDDEERGGQAAADQRAELLRGELEAAVAGEEHGARGLGVALLGVGQGGAGERARRVPDAAPEDLADGQHVGREARAPDAEVARAGLGDDGVARLEPLAEAWPEPGLRDGRVVRGGLLGGQGVGGVRARLDGDVAEALDDLGEDTVHADFGVVRVANADVVGVEVDGVHLRGLYGEAGGVEVGLQSANIEDQVG